MSIKFEDNYFVGFNYRKIDEVFGEGAEKTKRTFKLGYIVRDTNLVSFNNWRDSNIPIETIDNRPKKGFSIFGQTRRASEWFGTGRSMVYIEHPAGFIFEISVQNLLCILSYCDIVDNTFTEEMILAHEKGKLLLVPKNSNMYDKALEDTTRDRATKTKSVIKPSALKLGDEIELSNGVIAVYYGKYLSVKIITEWGNRLNDYRHNTDSSKRYCKIEDAGYIHYYLVKNSTDLSTNKSIKIYKIIKNTPLTESDAIKQLEKMFTKSYGIKYLPTLANTTINVVHDYVKRSNHHSVYDITTLGRLPGQLLRVDIFILDNEEGTWRNKKCMHKSSDAVIVNFNNNEYDITDLIV